MKAFAALAAGTFLLSIAAFAAAPVIPPLKPGLWEHSFTMKSQSGRMEAAMEEAQRQLEQMPAEQRRMMEQMLESQGMVMRPGGGVVKVCLTEADIARGALPEQEGCRQEILEQSRERLRVRFVCEGDPPTSGEGDITFHGPERYTGKATLRTEIDGQPDVMTVDQSGRWLSSDCGDIEPND